MSMRGFSMLEVLVVMGIFVLVGGFALLVSMESFHGSNFRTDRNTLIAALQRARAQAVNNICLGPVCTDGKPHGVKILPGGSIVIFEGATYATRDAGVDAIFHTNAAAMSGANEFVFSQLSGTTSCASGCAVTMTDQAGHISTATTSAEGRIYWSN